MTARSIRVAALLALATILSSCGGQAATHEHAGPAGAATSQSARSAAHNAADVAFAQTMIPHHQQAVDMAAMVPTRTTNPELRLVAAHIGADQRAEIQTLTTWLAQWNETVAPHHGGHDDHAAMDMNGMVDQATLARLQSLTNSAFDTLWVQSMIAHHQGAVEMAQAEITHGENTDAVQMGRLIVTSQQREIAYMNTLLSVSE